MGRSTQGNAAAAAEHGAICQVHVQDGTYKTVLITSETPDVRDIIRTVSFPFLPPYTAHPISVATINPPCLHFTPRLRNKHKTPCVRVVGAGAGQAMQRA